MKKFILIASLAASFAVAATAHATQFVTNGDFSQLSNGPGRLGYGGATTVATDWSTTGYNFAFSNGNTDTGGVKLWTSANGGSSTWNGTAPGGVNFAALDGDYNTAPLSQTITGLKVGKTYTLSFDYAFGQQTGFNGDTIQSISTSLGGSTVFTSSNFDVASHGFSGWQTYSGVITATSTSEVLSFLAKGNLPVPPFALFTEASLTGSVPEPATWGMMIVGLGAMGAAARLRRRRVATTA